LGRVNPGQKIQKGAFPQYRLMKNTGFIVYRSQKLTILLRILGFDVLYLQDEDYTSAINLAKKTQRILISRVKFLRKLPWIFYLSSDNLEEQLEELLKGLELEIERNNLFSRCSSCNNLLQEVQEEEIKNELPKDVCRKDYWFKKCPNCGKIFWNGTHIITLEEKFKKLNIHL